jgi:hypothetical protein
MGSKHEIIGDIGQVKNGWKYHVWGLSDQASTWVEQNTTTNGPQRPLRRTLVAKNESIIEEEKVQSHAYEQSKGSSRAVAMASPDTRGFIISGHKDDVAKLVKKLEADA